MRQLEILTAVAEHGSFTAAARALHTAQSNVSAQVARLEAQLGVGLVDRINGRLTPAGDLVVGTARRIRDELVALDADLATETAEVSGGVRLGTIGTSARWLLPRLLDDLDRRHPRVQLRIIESVTTALVTQLLNSEIDLAILNLPQRDRDLRTIPLFTEDLVLCAPHGHPLAAHRAPVSLREIAQHPILLGPPGSRMRDDLDRVAAAAGATLRARAELDGVRLAASLAFEGYCPTIVPATAVRRGMDGSATVVRAIVERPQRIVGLGLRRGRYSAAAEVVRSLLNEAVRQLSDGLPGVTAIE